MQTSTASIESSLVSHNAPRSWIGGLYRGRGDLVDNDDTVYLQCFPVHDTLSALKNGHIRKIISTRDSITNDIPSIWHLLVNSSSSGDRNLCRHPKCSLACVAHPNQAGGESVYIYMPYGGTGAELQIPLTVTRPKNGQKTLVNKISGAFEPS